MGAAAWQPEGVTELAFGAERSELPPVRPDHGGRLELTLKEASNASARYALTIFTPEAEPSTSAVVAVETGVIEFGDWLGGAPPAWLVAVAHALLRSVWRSKLSEGEWPRRITRWRPAPKD